LQIVQLTMEPGASVAEIARAHGVNANQVFTWRRLFDNSQLSDAGARSTALLPVADHPINRIGEFLPWNLAASLQSESAEAA
jgi:transposase-like protein